MNCRDLLCRRISRPDSAKLYQTAGALGYLRIQLREEVLPKCDALRELPPLGARQRAVERVRLGYIPL
jgi:hypothetical protein